MKRAHIAARGLLGGTIAVGMAIAVVAVGRAAAAPWTTLAFLAAAAIATELIEVEGDETSFDPADGHNFSFSSPVHFAAAVLVGPWAGALVASGGVVLVDAVRGQERRKVLFNGGVFAIATLLGGYAFRWTGGVTAALALPRDFLSLLALVVVYVVVNTALVNTIVGLFGGHFAWSDLLDVEPSSRVPEAGLGIAIAVVSLREPWALVALVPLVLAVYQGHARLARLRRETTRALETFANVVDERDSTTYHHSDRVAEYVRRTAEQLQLPTRVAQRLRWAGRLHDLGKVAVDAAVLRKPGALTQDELATIHRHPRLSARLLRRFRFATEEARSVEYHHERHDGNGYYGIPGEELSFASALLVIADSFDAMTSDRPYRRGLAREEALAEIERHAGTQFHPLLARAFVAAQRGEPVEDALTPRERDELRAFAAPPARRPPIHLLNPREQPEVLVFGGAVLALLLAGVGVWAGAACAGAVAVAGLATAQHDRRAAHRLARALRSVVGQPAVRAEAFAGLVGVLTGLCGLRTAALVGWRERELTGSVILEHGTPLPTELALTSWFIREADTSEALIVAAEGELGVRGFHVAVRLRIGRDVVAFLVLGFAAPLPRRVLKALAVAGPEFAHALAPPLHVVEDPALAAGA